MYKILNDTSVWLDLAKEPQQRPLLNVLFELECDKTVSFLVPGVVLDEFQRNKKRVAEQSTRSFSSTLKRVKEFVGKYGDGEFKEAALEQINRVDQKLPRLGDSVVNALKNVEILLNRAEIIETTESMKARAAQRALDGKAPFHRQKNSMADALIIEAFADCVTGPKSKGHTFALVTHNTNDFSEAQGNTKKPHPDLTSLFTARKSRYYTTLADALNSFRPDAVAEFSVDLEEEPRRTDEILEATEVLFWQIWYNRHAVIEERVRTGRTKGKPEAAKLLKWAEEQAAKEVGRKNLGPWTDFEWGMLNGKLSALRWVLGSEWDFLDT